METKKAEIKTSQQPQKAKKESVNNAIDAIKEYGGFAFVENIIDGYSNLNPKRKARKNLFLTDEQWGGERKNLKNKLSVWLEILKSSEKIDQMVDTAKDKSVKIEELLNTNLKAVLEKTKDLETSYRSVALFYANTESDKVKNITILNADLEQVKDIENPLFVDFVSNEMKQNFDRLDLKSNYSILVVPGYLGSNSVLNRWSKIAYENKAVLVTDFQDLESPEDVVDMYDNVDHSGQDIFKSNTLMTCNWLLGRKKEESVGEEDDLCVPPSSALAGRIYQTLMSQVVAGKKFGGINNVESVRFDLKKSEISEIEKLGLVPMVNEYGKVMAFSAKTLFITKVLFDFLNRRAFENWNSRTEADLRSQIVKFLDDIQGPTKLIEKFRVMKIEQDQNQKDRVLIDIHITPYFPSKSFVIQLDGHKGDGPEDAVWHSEYKQE